MRGKHELEQGCADVLHNLRVKKGMSKSQIADALYLDAHTWRRYENGDSAPSVPDFIRYFDSLGESMLRPMLDYLYPEIYSELDCDSTDEEYRQSAIHYFQNIASKRELKLWTFLMFGNHGSNILPQLEMINMIDHLPMKYRFAVAQLIDTLYTIAEYEGTLINNEHMDVNKDIFHAGLAKGGEAAKEGRNSYTTSID